MAFRFDHVVIAVEDLDVAVADYAQVGFTVTPGGEHASGSTHNALICFQDGTYIELLAPTGRGAQPGTADYSDLLELGEGCVAYALATDNLTDDAHAMQSRGIRVMPQQPGSRVLKDGTQVKWKTLQAGSSMSPFFIEDITPHSLRVPDDAAATTHANGITGISGLRILADNLDRSVARYEAMLGMTSPRAYGSVRFPLGDFTLQLTLATSDRSRAYLRDRGGVPYEIYFAGGGDEQLDPHLTHGARLMAAPKETER